MYTLFGKVVTETVFNDFFTLKFELLNYITVLRNNVTKINEELENTGSEEINDMQKDAITLLINLRETLNKYREIINFMCCLSGVKDKKRITFYNLTTNEKYNNYTPVYLLDHMTTTLNKESYTKNKHNIRKIISCIDDIISEILDFVYNDE